MSPALLASSCARKRFLVSATGTPGPLDLRQARSQTRSTSPPRRISQAVAKQQALSAFLHLIGPQCGRAPTGSLTRPLTKAPDSLTHYRFSPFPTDTPVTNMSVQRQTA